LRPPRSTDRRGAEDQCRLQVRRHNSIGNEHEHPLGLVATGSRNPRPGLPLRTLRLWVMIGRCSTITSRATETEQHRHPSSSARARARSDSRRSACHTARWTDGIAAVAADDGDVLAPISSASWRAAQQLAPLLMPGEDALPGRMRVWPGRSSGTQVPVHPALLQMGGRMPSVQQPSIGDALGRLDGDDLASGRLLNLTRATHRRRPSNAGDERRRRYLLARRRCRGSGPRRCSHCRSG
jgi:hypothetical protein